MDNQQFQPVQNQSIWTIILPTIIITALIVGGGVWYWQKSSFEKAKEQIEELNEQITESQKRLQEAVILPEKRCIDNNGKFEVRSGNNFCIFSDGKECSELGYNKCVESKGEWHPDITAGYTGEIYKNEEYKFTFEYPSEFSIVTRNDPKHITLSGDEFENNELIKHNIDIQTFDIENKTLEDIVSDFKDYLEREKDNNPYHKISEEKIIVGGETSVELKYIIETGEKLNWKIETYFIKNNTGYSISYTDINSITFGVITLEQKINKPIDISAYNQILSTFKFTN